MQHKYIITTNASLLVVCLSKNLNAVVVVIAWYLDLLPIQSVTITVKVVSSKRAHGQVFSAQLCVIKVVSDFW